MLNGKPQRDTIQVESVARQMFFPQSALFTYARKMATDRPYGYLILDFESFTITKLMLRRNLLHKNLFKIAQVFDVPRDSMEKYVLVPVSHYSKYILLPRIRTSTHQKQQR